MLRESTLATLRIASFKPAGLTPRHTADFAFALNDGGDRSLPMPNGFQLAHLRQLLKARTSEPILDRTETRKRLSAPERSAKTRMSQEQLPCTECDRSHPANWEAVGTGQMYKKTRDFRECYPVWHDYVVAPRRRSGSSYSSASLIPGDRSGCRLRRLREGRTPLTQMPLTAATSSADKRPSP